MKIRLTKQYKTDRNKFLNHTIGVGTQYFVTYSSSESGFGYNAARNSFDFVLASNLVDGGEEILESEREFFSNMIDKIFGRDTVRLTKVVENDGSDSGKITECTIEDGYVAERGIVGRTQQVFVHPNMADIAYYVVVSHNNKANIIKKETKEYKKIRR